MVITMARYALQRHVGWRTQSRLEEPQCKMNPAWGTQGHFFLLWLTQHLNYLYERAGFGILV